MPVEPQSPTNLMAPEALAWNRFLDVLRADPGLQEFGVKRAMSYDDGPDELPPTKEYPDEQELPYVRVINPKVITRKINNEQYASDVTADIECFTKGFHHVDAFNLAHRVRLAWQPLSEAERAAIREANQQIPMGADKIGFQGGGFAIVGKGPHGLKLVMVLTAQVLIRVAY